jgi:MFS family permease
MRVSSELVKLDHKNRSASSYSSYLSSNRHWLLASTICALGAIFYCYEYFLRVAPSVMFTEIATHYQIEAVTFGNLVAFYYYAYTPMQLPVGILMDRYGARKILTLACLLCAMGTFLFVATPTLLVGQAGRFMVGFGSAFAYVGVLTLASSWLPSRAFAMFAGLACSLGMLGAISGDITMTILVEEMGWKSTMAYAGAMGLILTPIIWMVVKDKPHMTQSGKVVDKPKEWHALTGIYTIIKNPQMWINGVIGSFMFLPIAAFAELWGVPFLKDGKGFTAQEAAVGVSMIFLGFAVGGPLWGWLSDRIRRRLIPMMLGALLSCAALSASIYLDALGYGAILVFLFLSGMFSSAQILVFAVGRDNTSHVNTGTAMAFTNMLVMVGGAVLQPAIGYFLDLSKGLEPVTERMSYTINDYHSAMLVLPISLFVASLMICLLRETYCKQIQDR